MLFVIRETPNESLGVSPFELLFGRKVRGTLRVVRDKLLDSTSHKLASITKYLDTLKATITNVHTFAQNNLKQTQHIMKEAFDKKAKVRSFKEGDEVLAFIPIPGSPLQAIYHGPYSIKNKVSDTNYIINTQDYRKSIQSIHINLLMSFKRQVPALDQNSNLSTAIMIM